MGNNVWDMGDVEQCIGYETWGATKVSNIENIMLYCGENSG